jgi:hypothetical protein
MTIEAAVATGGEPEQATAIRGLIPAEPGRGRGGILAGILGPARTEPCVDACPHPEELLARERARNELTWACLARLGIAEGDELGLDFFYETAGVEGDRKLAAFLRCEAAYEVIVETEGVKGRTPRMPVGPSALDLWVETMLYAGYEHGRCAFSGWTATVVRPAASRPLGSA